MLPVAILAGGLATRLRPITETIPKALIDIAGEPFIARQLRLLRSRGVNDVIVCAGFLGETIAGAIGDGAEFGLRVRYSFDGPALLGTAGALKRALPLLGPEFLALYGDSYLACDYARVADCLHTSGKRAVMTVFRNEGRWDASNVEFDDGRIVAYDKNDRTSRMRHIDYGLGAFRAEAFECVPEGSAYDLARLYRELLSEGDLAGCEIFERFYEIGSFAGIEELTRHIRGDK